MFSRFWTRWFLFLKNELKIGKKTQKFQVYFRDFVYFKFIFEINKPGMLKEVVATLFRNLSCSEVGIFCWRSIPNICCLRGFAEDPSQQLQRHFYFLKGVNEGNLVIWMREFKYGVGVIAQKILFNLLLVKLSKKSLDEGWFSEHKPKIFVRRR